MNGDIKTSAGAFRSSAENLSGSNDSNVGIEAAAVRPSINTTATSSESAQVIHHHEVLIMLQATLTFLVGALFVLTFIVQPFRIPSGSMEDTLLIGDFLLVNKAVFAPPGRWGHLLAYEPVRRDDIVVFHYPVDHSLHLVKRIIGVPGDRIHLHYGRVFINGRAQNEPFAMYIRSFPSVFRDEFPTPTYTDPGVSTGWWREMRQDVQNGELVVPGGEYFVLGDNRNDSMDSRYWGFVPQENVIGRPLLIYWSVRNTDQEMPASPTPGDKLIHFAYAATHVFQMTRWDRTFRVVR